MADENKKAMTIAIVAGIMLLLVGLSGMAAWQDIQDFVVDNIGDNTAIQAIFVVLIFIAALGGLAVIFGGILIGKNNVGVGKFLIALGVGLGLIGFILSIIIGGLAGSLMIGGFLSLGAIGIILSIVARRMAIKEEEAKPAKPAAPARPAQPSTQQQARQPAQPVQARSQGQSQPAQTQPQSPARPGQ